MEDQNDNSPEEIEDIPFVDERVDYKFDLTFYGADYPVDALVKRLQKKDIVIPSFDPANEEPIEVEAFQRKFVWTKLQCDRFVESLLLGLPVPGIFLVQQSNKSLLVLDGQQRLLTLSAFYLGVLNKKEFTLENVQDQFRGMTYKTMPEEHRRTLDDSIIHATVIKKTQDSQDLSSVYTLFERLNSGGTQLSPHEIRVALVPGKLMQLIRRLNENGSWRAAYGAPSKTLKDHELILRFIALRFSPEAYKSPMKDFLTRYAQFNKDLDKQGEKEIEEAFTKAIQVIVDVAGKRAFRIKTALNAAMFDSVMVGLSRRLAENAVVDAGKVKIAYEALLEDTDYLASIGKATAREDQVADRIRLATEAFSAV
ncbi:MAG TPA: DUF262 domain-containing protein [Luteimonas sp.]|nr:DUF262 domain-containing protein [Luteimonas sp.]